MTVAIQFREALRDNSLDRWSINTKLLFCYALCSSNLNEFFCWWIERIIGSKDFLLFFGERGKKVRIGLKYWFMDFRKSLKQKRQSVAWRNDFWIADRGLKNFLSVDDFFNDASSKRIQWKKGLAVDENYFGKSSLILNRKKKAVFFFFFIAFFIIIRCFRWQSTYEIGLKIVYC